MRPATLCTTLYQDHKNSDFHQYLLYLIISFVDCVPRQLLTSSTHSFNILVIFYIRFKFVLFVYFNSSFDGKLLYISQNYMYRLEIYLKTESYYLKIFVKIYVGEKVCENN